MKNTFILVFALFALNSFAAEDGEIIKETWTCKNDNIALTAVFSPNTATAEVAAYGSENVALQVAGEYEGLPMGRTSKLSGERIERDTWSFDATLVRSSEDFEWSNKKSVTTKAQLSLITDMFIDCVGERATADLLDCSVVIERK